MRLEERKSKHDLAEVINIHRDSQKVKGKAYYYPVSPTDGVISPIDVSVLWILHSPAQSFPTDPIRPRVGPQAKPCVLLLIP